MVALFDPHTEYEEVKGLIKHTSGMDEQSDLKSTYDYGNSFPLSMAIQIIEGYGGWVKPEKENWRPREPTNSPLKFNLKYKNEGKNE